MIRLEYGEAERSEGHPQLPGAVVAPGGALPDLNAGDPVDTDNRELESMAPVPPVTTTAPLDPLIAAARAALRATFRTASRAARRSAARATRRTAIRAAPRSPLRIFRRTAIREERLAVARATLSTARIGAGDWSPTAVHQPSAESHRFTSHTAPGSGTEGAPPARTSPVGSRNVRPASAYSVGSAPDERRRFCNWMGVPVASDIRAAAPAARAAFPTVRVLKVRP